MVMNIKLMAPTFIILILFFSGQALAQSEPNRASFFIETDPSTFVFGGYAAHLRFKPADNKHLLFGFGTYALNFPKAMVNMNAENKNKGWKLRINTAYSFFGEYYFGAAGEKWYTGLQVGVQNFRLKNETAANNEVKYQNLLLMPSVGYSWAPFKSSLYLKPWLGLGYTTKISGKNVLQGQTYDIAPIVPFFTLHVGYRF